MVTPAPTRSSSDASQDSVTAMDYINEQLRLESDAREALPYAFDTCTRPIGRLRQPIYACRTCVPLNPTTPPRFGQTEPHGAAALCYSCSIQCHGDHELVEIFEKRDVVCDCGTKRLPGARCELRKAQDDEIQGDGEARYGQNFWGRFCQCEVQYDPEKEKGTMFQCFLGDVCGEDWFHDVCVVGLGPPHYDGNEKAEEKEKAPVELTVGKENGTLAEVKVGEEAASNGEVEESAELASNLATQAATEDEDEREEMIPGFPKEDFEHFICWRCVEANPWLQRYAGSPGFFPGVVRQEQAPKAAPASAPTTFKPAANNEPAEQPSPSTTRKRKATEDPTCLSLEPQSKRARTPDPASITSPAPAACKAPKALNSSRSSQPISLLLKEGFRTHLCRCLSCFPLLSKHRVLLEEEHTYEPPLSRAPSSTGSLYDRGEKALGSIDRVRAIEGVMAYNMLKEKVKAFLQPFAESGQPVGKEDVEAYFEGLKENGEGGGEGSGSSVEVRGNGRKEGEAK